MNPLLVILGPTASGKTNLACQVALKYSGEIISADSRQVYRRMDIGTGKDIEEYTTEGIKIPYHLIDIVEPGTKYHIGQFQLDFIEAYHHIRQKQHLPILCGGSGLYLETAIEGQSFLGIKKNKALRDELEKLNDKELLKEVKKVDADILDMLTVQTRDRKIRAIEIQEYLRQHPDHNPAKVPQMDVCIIGVDIEREARRNKITTRLRKRLKEGMVEEVENLLNEGLSHEVMEYYGLEYKWISLYLQGEVDYTQMFEKLEIAIHQFAKRQMTWFRGMERKGNSIHWLDYSQPMEEKINFVQEKMRSILNFNHS
ncbi:MAG: tRNA (adenosine(37)-N6)-dimethylallyltransferase MiaA [Crocinitomicaceae bacterium]|nr:tRNA (adenosine(37)-N6)-dimethylallyltransferase MiaA [Crocinitomicaceae bacterium]